MTPKDKRRQRRKEKRVAERPKLTPEQQTIVDCFEELNAAINMTKRNFDRMAMVVDGFMKRAYGIVDTPQPLRVVQPEENPADVIAAAQAALGEPKETVN